jgi:hypothetical protein
MAGPIAANGTDWSAASARSARAIVAVERSEVSCAAACIRVRPPDSGARRPHRGEPGAKSSDLGDLQAARTVTCAIVSIGAWTPGASKINESLAPVAGDGLLDVNSPQLRFSERAGQSQAARHLKARLGGEASLEMRSAIAELLRRHCATDDLHQWWWAQATPTLAWLQTAAELGVLSDLSEPENDTLAATLTGLSTDTVWLAALVDQGGYNGRHGEIIALCKTDVNDGAADVIAPIQMTSVVPLVECAAKAQQRPHAHSAHQRARRTRIRQRGNPGHLVLRGITELSNYLSERPLAEATANDWFNRLKRIAQIWGDGWVLRQAIATVPSDLDRPQEPEPAQQIHPVGALRGRRTTSRLQITQITRDRSNHPTRSVHQPIRLEQITRLLKRPVTGHHQQRQIPRHIHRFDHGTGR